MPGIFISHCSEDIDVVEPFVEFLRHHYLATWYSPRSIDPGSWEQQIRQGLDQCDWFVVLLSPAAVASAWVRREVEMAIAEPRFFDPERGLIRIIPILTEACAWRSLHPSLDRCQLLDWTKDLDDAKARLLRVWHVDPHTLPQFRAGDVYIPVHIFVGGDGSTRYKRGDILCNQPESVYRLPPDLAAIAEGPNGRAAQKEREAKAKGRQMVNNRQIRLNNAWWGSTTPGGGLSEKPLHLELGWTEYFHTIVTNMETDFVMPDGLSVGQKYQGPLDSFTDSHLSNPFAVNLSIVTRDNWIYVARRSQQVAWNVGGLQPAVSGDGQMEDLAADGSYDPFLTAQREATEEATGLYVPSFEEITFFGLARTFKTRFPFLFGEIRVQMSRHELESQKPTKAWEGRLIDMGMPFTVEAVTEWVRQRYIDQKNGRIGPAIGTTLFSLLQSLLYAHPQRWTEIVKRLTL